MRLRCRDGGSWLRFGNSLALPVDLWRCDSPGGPMARRDCRYRRMRERRRFYQAVIDAYNALSAKCIERFWKDPVRDVLLAIESNNGEILPAPDRLLLHREDSVLTGGPLEAFVLFGADPESDRLRLTACFDEHGQPGRCLWNVHLFTWIGDADDAAGNTAARIADRLAAIIRFGMHNNPPANNRVFGACNGDVVHCDLVVSLAFIVGLDIAEVTRMARGSGGCAGV